MLLIFALHLLLTLRGFVFELYKGTESTEFKKMKKVTLNKCKTAKNLCLNKNDRFCFLLHFDNKSLLVSLKMQTFENVLESDTIDYNM